MHRDYTTALRLLEGQQAKPRLSTGYLELDRLLGNGVEPGVFYLFYGDAESGVDLLLHRLLAETVATGDRAGRAVYLNCGNYREDKTILDIPSLVRCLKVNRVDPREGLTRIIVYCAFSEEQQEQVVEEVRQAIEETKEVRLLVVHHVAKLFTAQGNAEKAGYRRIPRLQRAVLRLWQTCAAHNVAMVASCRPAETRRGRRPRPEGGRYLSHEANVIVHVETVKGLTPATQVYLLKHPARAQSRAVLKRGGEDGVGRITIPFKVKLERELDALKGFRDALKDAERQAAYDQIVKACTSEQGALANTDIPALLDAMLLTASVDNRRHIERLTKQLDRLAGQIQHLTSCEPD